MRKIVLVALAGVLLALALSSVASAFPTDWKKLAYFDASRSELRLTTTLPDWEKDCDWKGPTEGTYATNLDTTVQPLDWTDFNCITSALWAKTCKPGRQTVTFEKKLYLPGAATDLDVSLYSFHDEPVNMTLEINGGIAVFAVKSVHKRDLRGKESLFKEGVNTVTVEATKPKTGKPCNVDGVQYAVAMQMRAIFANDFKVQALPKPPKSHFEFTLTATNAGPSKASLATVVSAHIPPI